MPTPTERPCLLPPSLWLLNAGANIFLLRCSGERPKALLDAADDEVVRLERERHRGDLITIAWQEKPDAPTPRP